MRQVDIHLVDFWKDDFIRNSIQALNMNFAENFSSIDHYSVSFEAGLTRESLRVDFELAKGEKEKPSNEISWAVSFSG